MVHISDSTKTTCPSCGEPMGLVTWTGEQPVCASCAGATTVGTGLDLGVDTDQECLHEALERSLPPNQRGGAHALVCNCPKCSVIC